MDTHADTRAPLWQMRAERSAGTHADFKLLYTLAWYRRLADEARAQKVAGPRTNA